MKYDTLYKIHIRESIERIEQYVDELELEQFLCINVLTLKDMQNLYNFQLVTNH